MTVSNKLPRILVVDDNPVNTAICEEILCEDFHVYTAVDGESALAAAAEVQPDLILLDVMMPGIDGLEVCRRLRQSSRPWVKIIMVSAKAQLTDRLSGYVSGADDYVTKPFDEEELLSKIRVYLRLKHVEEINDIKNQVLEVLQHGNRTPVTQILANAELLTLFTESLTLEERVERVNSIKSAANRLCDWLTAGELLVALRSDQAAFSPEWVNVEKVICQAVETIRERQPDIDTMIQARVPQDLCAQCDEDLAHVLITRLLHHALIHTAEDGVVEINAQALPDGQFSVQIVRGGLQISESHMTSFFEPFSAPDEVLHNQDDGMGMAIVREIAILHGGFARASNLPDGRVAIRVQFPIGCPPHDAQQNHGTGSNNQTRSTADTDTDAIIDRCQIAIRDPARHILVDQPADSFDCHHETL